MLGLADLYKPEVKSAWFNNQQVKLDGYRFIGCRFDNCQLFVESTDFELIGCLIDDRTIINYGPQILKVVQLFNSRIPWIYANMPFFAPRRNADGTITIGA